MKSSRKKIYLTSVRNKGLPNGKITSSLSLGRGKTLAQSRAKLRLELKLSLRLQMKLILRLELKLVMRLNLNLNLKLDHQPKGLGSKPVCVSEFFFLS